MNQKEIKALAKFRAGLILQSILGDWQPDDLIEQHGQDTVDAVADEIGAIARRLIEQGGGR
ncbi:hypothetical protein [Streptomyces sp. gCLA4]|uniref:hypothetical protein n=1 Tax=Streptomyces sp. gCLA4 TaxID=1873416 RepID=UPI001604223D|nr:hypothetical protein [Streptomyces sp. gCLA4]